MDETNKTIFHDKHVAAGGKMIDFAGWRMPLHYTEGIVAEHLVTRKSAGLFDVSHMGRFVFSGRGARGFLQHCLTNNVDALEVGQAQYTMIPTPTGGAVDDAYLYRFVPDEYLLVVNAANRKKDWDHFQRLGEEGRYGELEMRDVTTERVMLALQGPGSKQILLGVIDSGALPEPKRNELSCVTINGASVRLGRTGYTGEPLGFEMFGHRDRGPALWDLLVQRGATPVGLGARDTLRLEAGLPLYGQELGLDADGREIPIFSCPLARHAVSFSPLKGDYVGREALRSQRDALKGILERDFSRLEALSRWLWPIAVLGRGIARPGDEIHYDGGPVGRVTSGTMVPYWKTVGRGLSSHPSDEHALRPIGLALVDSRRKEDDEVEVKVRGRTLPAVLVPYHLRSDAPPYARPIVRGAEGRKKFPPRPSEKIGEPVLDLLRKTRDNTIWRQRQCINLIPSEQTQSPGVRMLSIMDPAFRYAEHKEMPAFDDVEVFYYQGTDFIHEVEQRLEEQMRDFLGCRQIEGRVISGQMANTAVFSAMVDYLNRADRRSEQRRMRSVMNNNIIKGGHLSSQPMGALRDFVARDPNTERPAVISFPVTAADPYRTDVAACAELIERNRPELIIFGKSMVLYPEPVSQIRTLLTELGHDAVIMYDAAHVLGLLGEHFQQPFTEGAELVTASTHKTFFGTQRGLIGCDYDEDHPRWELWEALRRRVFPGSVSNHHLGTLLGLLLAAYEMNYFKQPYQQAVLANAKALAKALVRLGVDVAGDPEVGYTQTHQVVIHVGYGRGPELAQRLEANNIIVNYQATPTEEGFTAAGGIRMGVGEMTRFGLGQKDFQRIAELIYDVLVHNRQVRDEVIALREDFRELHYCFTGEQVASAMHELHELVG